MVGADAGGLLTAARLAHLGYRTLVAERHRGVHRLCYAANFTATCPEMTPGRLVAAQVAARYPLSRLRAG